MVNPIPAFTASALTAVVIALMTEGAVVVNVITIPSCNSVDDWFGGCDNIISRVLALVVLGTIPGLHAAANAMFAVAGLSLRGTAIWAGLRLLRGGG